MRQRRRWWTTLAYSPVTQHHSDIPSESSFQCFFFPPRLVTVATRTCCFNFEPTLCNEKHHFFCGVALPLPTLYLTNVENKTSLLWCWARLWMLCFSLCSLFLYCLFIFKLRSSISDTMCFVFFCAGKKLWHLLPASSTLGCPAVIK